MSIKLGDKARDTITGLEGVVVCDTKWLNGCRRWGIQPTELKDGLPLEVQFFDEQQVEAVAAAPPRAVRATGGPQQDPSSRRAGE